MAEPFEMVLSLRQEEGGLPFRREVRVHSKNETLVDAWIEFTTELRIPAPTNLDGALLLVILRCMQHGGILRIDGPISKSIVRSLHHFQQAWVRWRPDRYKLVHIHPTEYSAASLPHDRAIASFSGGIDSTFLAISHSSTAAGAEGYPLTDVLFAHGLDVPYDEIEGFKNARLRGLRCLASTGLVMNTVRTNIRSFYKSNYEDAHGAIICGLLHQFSHRFGYGLIASSNSYENLRLVWGSNPVIDPLLSSHSFSIVHDGAGYNRLEKLSRVIKSQSARDNLRVCWRDKSYATNCGSCEKCILTQLELLALGHGDARCFDRPLNIELIATVTPASINRLRSYAWVLEASEQFRDQPWRVALERRVAALRRRQDIHTLKDLLSRLVKVWR